MAIREVDFFMCKYGLQSKLPDKIEGSALEKILKMIFFPLYWLQVSERQADKQTDRYTLHRQYIINTTNKQIFREWLWGRNFH